MLNQGPLLMTLDHHLFRNELNMVASLRSMRKLVQCVNPCSLHVWFALFYSYIDGDSKYIDVITTANLKHVLAYSKITHVSFPNIYSYCSIDLILSISRLKNDVSKHCWINGRKYPMCQVMHNSTFDLCYL
ncbi:hypothetical protein VPH35_019799 [Triticum aestivum]|uniref:Uncharacterized protein n=1 Tax=Triticum turgidum subsp. durum TaxID=4567 RepID=A0A9R1R4B9_TRITD|nr:unnamed protein product [Triticum turgidum subsp. durum]